MITQIATILISYLAVAGLVGYFAFEKGKLHRMGDGNVLSVQLATASRGEQNGHYRFEGTCHYTFPGDATLRIICNDYTPEDAVRRGGARVLSESVVPIHLPWRQVTQLSPAQVWSQGAGRGWDCAWSVVMDNNIEIENPYDAEEYWEC